MLVNKLLFWCIHFKGPIWFNSTCVALNVASMRTLVNCTDSLVENHANVGHFACS